ncbi:MAG: adenylyl-sulfate kinase [Candidatus Oxydemutatoraceae bacterium WSBS_2016_MAG_OTU14]
MKPSYSPKKQTYVFTEKDTTDDQLFISGTQLRKMLANNEPIPEWFSFPEIVEELKRTCLPLFQRGFALFFTGLSGSGKSTLARALVARLMEIGRINISILDGDIVRQHLSSELGFSKEHRSLNVRHWLVVLPAKFIKSENGIAICAQIAPYA